MRPTGRTSGGCHGAMACLVGALAIGIVAFGHPAAAEHPGPMEIATLGDGPAAGPGNGFILEPDPLIRRVQEALSQIGAYAGPITGRMNQATEEAIRTYQRKAGLTVDGKVSEDLANHIETDKQVDELLGKLRRSHREGVEAARRALLSDPATRDLVGRRRHEAADPTRDFAPCLHAPTAACLLAEAAESAKAIVKDDRRDWALGELLAVQARAGLADEARATARQIVDPRLVMVALRNIAEGQAAAGHMAAAREAAGIIPDPDRKAEALIAIATIQARGDGAAAVKTLENWRAILARVGQPARRIALMCQVAVVLAAAGDGTEARRTLAEADGAARTLSAEGAHDSALRNVAEAMAEMGRPEEALRALRDIGSDSDVTPVLIAAANAQAEAGDPAGALATAKGIEAGRYKAVVLSRIALAQARVDGMAAALATLDQAATSVDRITLPFARDFANSRIALALADLAQTGGPGLFGRSVQRATDIADSRLRAQTLWTIAIMRRRAGDSSGAEATRALADIASREVKSRLSQVWLWSDVAIQHHRDAETAVARRAFNKGLSLAAGIGNAWDRSRALSRMAATLIELAEPRPTRTDFSERP